MNQTYCFCEPAHVTGKGPRCVRILTDRGRKFSGGVDTNSLCGRIEAPYGWDLHVAFDRTHPAICQKCLREIEKRERGLP